MRQVMALVTLFLVFPGAAFSDVLYVPDDHLSIQDAINSAAGGDQIFVRSGTYVENIDFLGKEITVESESGPQSTMIDGNAAGSVVTFDDGEGALSVLMGFTIRNGRAAAGGGIYCAGSSPTLTNNIIERNSAVNILGGLGGGIYMENASPSITNSIIRLNAASSSLDRLWENLGGGIYCCSSSAPLISGSNISGNSAEKGGGICCEYSAATIDGNSLSGNTADCGGAIYTSNCSPSITNNSIPGNTAGYDGGGGICCTDQSDPVISGNVISDNTSSYQGGGILCSSQSVPAISDNLIAMNEASSGGGIICYYDCLVSITNNKITNNTADYHGAGIRCERACAVISGNRIENNAAGWGGGISCYTLSTLFTETEITANVISGNSAVNDGGGIDCSYHCQKMTNNIVSRNTAGNDGGGIYHGLNNDPSSFVNNTVFGNTAASRAGGIYCDDVSLTIMNSILWNNSAPTGAEIFESSGGLVVYFCNVENGTGETWFGAGCIDSDPLFVDTAVDDFHLTVESPCWNAGSNTAPGLPDEDFEGDPRIAFPKVDMGADEFHTHLYYTGPASPGGTIEIKVIGLPGSAPVQIALGSGVQDPPRPTPLGYLHLALPIKPYSQSPIPSTGVLAVPVVMNSFWVPGTSYPFQARVGNELSNLLIVSVE